MLAIRLFLLLLLLPFCGKAQKYFTTRFRLAEGLPSEEVRATIRGKYGFLWVATDGGLLRFDGRSFHKQYRSFLLPKGSPYYQEINPLLVNRIHRADWPEVLRRYNLEEEE